MPRPYALKKSSAKTNEARGPRAQAAVDREYRPCDTPPGGLRATRSRLWPWPSMERSGTSSGLDAQLATYCQLDSPTRVRAQPRDGGAHGADEAGFAGNAAGRGAEGAFADSSAFRRSEELAPRAESPPAWQVETLRSRRAGECLNRLAERVSQMSGACQPRATLRPCFFRTHVQPRRVRVTLRRGATASGRNKVTGRLGPLPYPSGLPAAELRTLIGFSFSCY